MTEDKLEGIIVSAATAEIRANPTKCSLKILARKTLEIDPRKDRVSIGKHACKDDPPCPEVLNREVEGD